MGNTRQLPDAVIEAISHRLSLLADLRLPAQLRRDPQGGPSEQNKQDYLKRLLLHDPGVLSWWAERCCARRRWRRPLPVRKSSAGPESCYSRFQVIQWLQACSWSGMAAASLRQNGASLRA